MSRRDGFSLIEALVALTIAALVLSAVFALQQQMTLGQLRHERALTNAALRRNALELLAEVNPMLEPEGRRDLTAGRVLTWTSTERTPVRRNIGEGFGDGAFDVALYEVNAEIIAASGRPLARLQIERVGWRRISEPGLTPDL